MSLTTCIRKAGAALNPEDKAAIMAAAKANRAKGMSADDAARAAVDARLQEVRVMLANAEKAPTVEPAATHQDPGEAPEVATKPVIAEAMRTAARNEDRKPSEMKADLLRQIDQAMASAKGEDDTDVRVYNERSKVKVDQRALDRRGLTGVMREKAEQEIERRIQAEKMKAAENIGYVEFDVPGDGRFKVLNTKDRLAEFRRKVESSPGFKDRSATSVAPDRVNGNRPVKSAMDLKNKQAGTAFGVERGSGTAKTAIEAMVDEGDAQAAVDYAAMKGLDLAEVLKGQPERLKKVQGLTPTEAGAEPAPSLSEPASEPQAAAPEQAPQGEPAKPEGGESFSLADFDQTQSQAFKRWSNDAPLVRTMDAATHQFKSGEKVVVEAFHGTKRPDRVGETFKRSRATSGPMAFFTSDPTLASSYAMGKNDTSLSREETQYPTWFKFKPKGERSPVDIVRAWYRLPEETKAKIAERAPRAMMQEDDDGNYRIMLGPEDHKSGTGSYDYNLERTKRSFDRRGNPLEALVEDWLNSGNLFNDEERFMEVLRLVGFPVADVTYDAPTAEYPFVYKTFIAMQKPLVTDDMPQEVRDALRDAAKRDRSRAAAGGADAWDKNTRTLREWVQAFNDNSEYVWTSIPDKVTDVLKSLGYDGIVDMSGKGGGDKHRVYIPFEETQVKSALGNKGKFDPLKKNIMLSVAGRDRSDDTTWYSELARKIESAGMNAAPASGWKQMLAGLPSKGVKRDEIEWSGLPEWLDMQTGKVTKQAVLEYLRTNGVQVQETVLGGNSALVESVRDEQRRIFAAWGYKVEPDPFDSDRETIYDSGDEEVDFFDLPDELQDAIRQSQEREQSARREATKYESYTLPGGTNYREVLLTLPVKRTLPLGYTVVQRDNGKWYVKGPDGYLKSSPYESAELAVSGWMNSKGSTGETGAYRSGHWDQPNILAHIRVNDRTDADGKRVLFVEEIQSDWAQEGKKRGFNTKADPEQVAREVYGRPLAELDAVEREGVALEVEARDEGTGGAAGSSSGRIPRAPFVDSTDKWVALALKRVIKMAVDEGYDRVAFVTGEQSAERYDLSKQISKVEFERTSGGIGQAPTSLGPGMLYAYDMNGRRVVSEYLTDPEKAEDYVGKEVAKRLLEQPGRATRSAGMGAHVRTLEGLDLKVGGEGMRAFYDKIVPAVAKDVLRKLGGGSLQSITLPGKPRDQGNGWGSTGEDVTGREASQQLAFDITPAMRERAAGGMPMFDVKGWGTVDGGAFPVDIGAYAQADLADRAAVRRLQDALNARGLAGVRLDALPARAGAPEGQPLRGTDRDRVAVAQLAQRIFDKRATYFTANAPVANGVVSSTQPDRIFLRFDMDKPHLAVFGHELLHTMRQDRPDLYEKLADRIRAITVGRAERDERLQQKYDRLGLPRLTADKVEEEFIADVVGDNFTDPEFWRALGRGQPEGFRRVLDAVMKWLDDVVERITRIRPLGTDKYLTDLNAAREAVADAMRNYSAGEVGTVADEAVSFSVADPTDSPAFRRWFGDSKVVDASGAPLVVYHGSPDARFATPGKGDGVFRTKREAAFGSDPGRAFFFAADQRVARTYADPRRAFDYQNAEEGMVPVFLSLKNPMVIDAGGQHWRGTEAVIEQARAAGHDGVIIRNSRDTYMGRAGQKNVPVTDVYVAFSPEQIKSATNNRGTYDPGDPNIMFSLADLSGPGPAQRRPVQQMVRNTLADMLGSAGARVSWWEKTIGTQYAKAEKHPEFKRVFDIAQQYLEDTSTLANEAADKADGILPKMETWQDWKRAGGMNDADAKAVAAPIFEGTLTDKKVYDDEELVSRFGLKPEQIRLYRQFLSSVNTSLDQAVTADVLRLVGDKNPALRELAITDREGFRDGVTDYLTEQIAQGVDADANQDLLTRIGEKYERIEKLKEEGYAPLMRFGEYKVHVLDEDGATLFFGLYESRREANKMARELATDPAFQGAKVEQGTISQEAYRLFSQVPLDSLEMFAEAIGADQSDVFQEFIKIARNNRSALKRLIKRNGTAGFSEDVPRVLASFVMSNARMAAGAMNLPAAKEAAADIRAGDVQDEAVRLLDTVQNPKETAGAIRGLMFVNFIGGSIASAVVNLTQPITMTLPYLSQWGGGVKAAARLMAAGKLAVSGRVADPDLRAALARAEAEGIVSPQEIHYLRAQASNSWGDKPWMRRLGFVWGAPFSLAEQFNRRVTFLAAYQTAKDQGMEDAFAFAENAVVETQGLYNKANAPNWARNPVGAVALTFKQFSIHYIEWMTRLWKSGPEGKKAVGLALALLIVAAGTDGLPFADDLDDLIDTLGQALGYDMNAKKARREFFANTLGFGDQVADVIARGSSAIPGIPMDYSIRMSMGNMLPGTGLFLRSENDRSRELLEFAGPGGSLAKQYMDAGQAALRGDVTTAVQTAVPIALQNVAKAMTMWETGEARDQLGRKVMDVDATDGLMRFLGFNPQALARESEKIQMIRRSEQLAKNVEGEIASDWARAVVDGDQEAVAAARQRLVDWNERNPEQPIVITPRQILNRARKLRQERLQRFITTVAPERRARVEEALAQ